MGNANIELEQPKPYHTLVTKVKGAFVRIGQHIACNAQLFLEAQTDTTSVGYTARFLVDKDSEKRKE